MKRARTAEAEAFWANRLLGSSMTQFISKPELQFDPDTRRSIKKTISTVELDEYDITVSTIFKSAWALILAKLSGRQDVVFGQLVSGRNLPIRNIEKVVGCCINEIPVRVNITSQTVLELLTQVQVDAASSIPFESMSLRDIIDECTDWPRNTTFGSILQHQNSYVPLEAPGLAQGMCTIRQTTTNTPSSDIFILSTPNGSETNVELTWSEGVIATDFVKTLLNELCSVVLDVAANPNRNVSSLLSSIGLSRCLPLSVKAHIPELTSFINTLLPNAASVKLIIDEAWAHVMGTENCPAIVCEDSTPFFDHWVKAIIAASFVEFYNRVEGISVIMDEIIENPSKTLQLVFNYKKT